MSLPDLQAVLLPIESARGLPNENYISASVYARERDAVFKASWAAIAFAHDVAKPGDVFPVDFMGIPLLIIHSRSGDIKVFQNTCRHRGMILVDAPTTLKGPIRCPYHSWCYSDEGALVRTPYIGGVDVDTHDDVDPAKLSLHQFPAHIWHGVVFVNLSGDAEPFEIVHADLLERWKPFDQPYYVGGEASQFEMDLNTNWKLAIENFCESYHLPWVHPELNVISPITTHENIQNHSGYSGQSSLNYKQITGPDGERFSDFKNLSRDWDTLAEYVSFFPNVMLGVHRDHAYANILMPQGPERTIERVALFYADPDVDQLKWQDMLTENARIWRDVFLEDIGVVEGMQRGRHGPEFDGGKFSPIMDKPTHIFHKWVAEKLLLGQQGLI